MKQNIAVSIICNTYNHEKYICRALESFLMQKTNFDFEVLVHDDASTDGTAQIIREYEKKYPDIIFPIYQHENQYSKDVKINHTFQYPRVRGKYIAMCEGDDYWIDSQKLQKQYDAMEKCPEVDICAHGAILLRDDKEVGCVVPSKQKVVFSTAEVINGGGGFVATGSLFYRASLEHEKCPAFREKISFDYTMQIHGALRGGMLFLPDKMSVYRLATESSWTVRMRSDSKKRAEHFSTVIEALEQLDRDTNYIYSKIVQEKILGTSFNLNYLEKNYRTLLTKKYKNVLKRQSLKRKCYIYLMAMIKKK